VRNQKPDRDMAEANHESTDIARGSDEAQPSLYQIRGIAKKAFQQPGGGEKFLRSERKRFDRAVNRKGKKIERLHAFSVSKGPIA
jgi:hypothetical protein